MAKLITEFTASLKERNAIQFDGLDPQGHVHFDVDAGEAANVLRLLTLTGQVFRIKIYEENQEMFSDIVK